MPIVLKPVFEELSRRRGSPRSAFSLRVVKHMSGSPGIRAPLARHTNARACITLIVSVTVAAR